MSRRLAILFGSLLVFAGIGVFLQVPLFFVHSALAGRSLFAAETARLQSRAPDHAAGGALRDRAHRLAGARGAAGAQEAAHFRSVHVTPTVAVDPRNPLRAEAMSARSGLPVQVAPVQAQPGAGRLVGVLRVPRLDLSAPIVQGTSDGQLSDAVGHLAASVLPGEVGLSVLAAHNATWFSHLNRLSPGDLVQLQTSYGSFTYRVSGARVVQTGSPLPNVGSPSVALETCYPLNALYLTPDRYLVTAQLVSGSLRASATQSGPQIGPQPFGYRPVVPQALWREGLTLQTNSIPMGSLTVGGKPSAVFTEGNAPLSAANGLEELFAGWLHASAQRNTAWLRMLAADSSKADPLYGVPVGALRYTSLFNVTLSVQGTDLTKAEAAIGFSVGGRQYHAVLAATVKAGDHLRLQSIGF